MSEAPPLLEAVPFPTDRGLSARNFLEAHGIVAVEPPIHSSDSGKGEFIYYLTRRLGLTPAFSYSEALTEGGYLHLRAQHYDLPAEQLEQVLAATLAKRKEEITNCGRAFGIGDERLADLYADEEVMARSAFGWWDAVADLRISNDIPSLNHWLRRPGFVELGRELTLRRETQWGPVVIIIDNLRYHKEQNTLWVVDYKSHDGEPVDRAQVCSLDFQTWLYMDTVAELLAEGFFKEHYGLPVDAKLGGMIHVIVRKPSIRLCSQDADYKYVSVGKKNKKMGDVVVVHGGRQPVWQAVCANLDGTEPERFESANEEEAVEWLYKLTGKKPETKAIGEPRRSNYIRRCGEWYRGDGQYLHLATERQAHPCVVLSRTTFQDFLDPDSQEEYRDELTRIRNLATRPPEPRNFSRHQGQRLIEYGWLSKFAPFFVCPVKDWPSIIQTEAFIIAHRDGTGEVTED